MTIDYTDAFLKYIAKLSTVPSTGARSTTKRTRELAEQLLLYASRSAKNASDPSRTQPRHVVLDVTPKKQSKTANDRVFMTITPIVKNRMTGQTYNNEAFNVPVTTDPRINLFKEPPLVIHAPPPKKNIAQRKNTQTQEQKYQAARFPQKKSKYKKGFAKWAKKRIFGQDATLELLEKDMRNFYLQDDPEKKIGFRNIFAFTGIGKTKMLDLIEEFYGIKMVRLNLKDNITDLNNFVYNLNENIKKACDASGGKCMLVFDEINTIREVDQEGKQIPHDKLPVAVSILHDLMDYGVYKTSAHTVDIRGRIMPFTVGNFPNELFNFSADPRITTHKVMADVHRAISSTEPARQAMLQKMFSVPTAARMLPGVHFPPPLSEADNRKIVRRNLNKSAKNSLLSKRGLTLTYSQPFINYLNQESITPSQGGRNTEESSSNMLDRILTDAISNLPKSIGGKKAELRIRHHRGRSIKTPPHILIDYRLEDDDKRTWHNYTKLPAVVSHPSYALQPTAKIPEQRMLVAAHELGHAYAAVMFGIKFERATAVGAEGGMGGFVTFRSDGIQTGEQLVAMLYAGIAARAMERVRLTDNPLALESRLKITTGSSMDLKMANELLDAIIAMYVDRTSMEKEDRDRIHRRPTSDLLESMEEYMVKQFLAAHPADWYRSRIETLARRGDMSDKAVYTLLGEPYTGNRRSPGSIAKALIDGHPDALEKLLKPSVKQELQLKNAVSYFVKVSEAWMNSGLPMSKKINLANQSRTIAKREHGGENLRRLLRTEPKSHAVEHLF